MRHLLLIQALVALLAASEPTQRVSERQGVAGRPERIYSESPATWYEDAGKRASVSQNGEWILYGNSRNLKLIELKTGRVDSRRLKGTLDEVSSAVFFKEDQLARLGRRGSETGWFLPAGALLHLSTVPPDAVPLWSPDGSRVAWYFARQPAQGLCIAAAADQQKFENLGGTVTALVWSADGSMVYVLVWESNGVSSLVRIDQKSRQVETVARDLDAAAFAGSIGLAPDGKHIFVALAGAAAPFDELRHQPVAPRNLNIYEINLENGARRLKVPSRTDVFAPTVAGEYLYWTRNDIKTSIVVLPAAGGEPPHQVVEQGQLPRWERPGGNRLAFIYGGWRLADWALNLDAGVVDVDSSARPTSQMRPIVTGFHEDFTPAWSPDGKWIAYHSHRSPRPVPSYSSEGSADDVFLRRADGPQSAEIRLTEFGWEVGPAEWSPDGRQLVFCSWKKGGTPGISSPWIVTIDPDSGKALRTDQIELPQPLKGAEEAAWSPQGHELAIEERTEENRRALWIFDLESKRARKLIDYPSTTYGGIAWTPDGKTIVYGGLAGNRMQLFAIPQSGGESRQLTHDTANLLHPSVSPNGRWIACTRIVQSKEIWRQKLPKRAQAD